MEIKFLTLFGEVVGVLVGGRYLLTEERGCTEMLPTPFIFGFLGPSLRDHMGPLLGHVVITLPPPTPQMLWQRPEKEGVSGVKRLRPS